MGHFGPGRSLCLIDADPSIMGAGRVALVPVSAALRLKGKKTAESDDMVSGMCERCKKKDGERE